MNPIQNSGLRLIDLANMHRLERIEKNASNQTSERDRLREVTSEFEVLFLQEVLKSMRDSSFESGLVRKSEGEKVFQSMLDEQYSRFGTQSGKGLGLGEMIYQQYQSHLDG